MYQYLKEGLHGSLQADLEAAIDPLRSAVVAISDVISFFSTLGFTVVRKEGGYKRGENRFILGDGQGEEEIIVYAADLKLEQLLYFECGYAIDLETTSVRWCRDPAVRLYRAKEGCESKATEAVKTARKKFALVVERTEDLVFLPVPGWVHKTIWYQKGGVVGSWVRRQEAAGILGTYARSINVAVPAVDDGKEE